MRNPAVGPAAVMAGYVRGDAGLDLIRAAAAKVAAGQSLLVFPEGTRTAAGAVVGPMKPGFALIADRAKAPVRLIVIRSDARACAPAEKSLVAAALGPAGQRSSSRSTRAGPTEPGRSAAELTRSV